MTAPDTRRQRFEALYTAHFGAVSAWALRRTDPATAQDIVADTFTVAWRRIDDAPADSLPWLLAVARNLLSNSGRADQRRAALRARLHHELSPPWESAAPAAIDPELAAAVKALAPVDRELILLVALEGLTPSQAAASVGITPTGARVRLHRARARLRRQLRPASARQTSGDTHTALPEEGAP